MAPCVAVDQFARLCNLAPYLHVNKTTETTCMQNHSRIQLRKSAIDQALDQAVQRVYDTYGSDLTKFFAAVQEQRLRQLEAELRKDESAPTQGAKTSPDQAK